VYRSLDALEDLNVVEHLHIGHGPTVYHLADEHHLHLICRQCGAVTELPERALDSLRTRVRRDHGFEIEPRHFAINGLCGDCLE
jgi:Fur family ferric uptake transcriptional regulator